MGKFGSTRVDIFLDGVRVGVADLDPARDDKFFFEPLSLLTEGEIITIAQRKNASEKEMDRMLAERAEAENKLKAAQVPENREAIRVYVGSIRPSFAVFPETPEFRVGPQSEMPVFVPSPEPPTPPVCEAPEPDPIFDFDLRPTIDLNRLMVLESRADRIDSVLNRYDARIKVVEDAIATFDFEEARKQLKSLDSKITNLKGEYNVTAANFKIHQQRCYCNSHYPGGFTKRDETSEDTNSAHASSKP
jgi:hypothetical protein